MNYRFVCKLLGLLLFLLSAALFVCLAYAFWDHERQAGFDAVESFAVSDIVTSLFGVILFMLGRGAGRELLRKEAIAVVGLGWFVCAGFGALPYVLCEPNLGPADAFFESVSGFTTTASSVIADLRQFPKGIFLWRQVGFAVPLRT